jgi:hypothetical protein
VRTVLYRWRSRSAYRDGELTPTGPAACRTPSAVNVVPIVDKPHAPYLVRNRSRFAPRSRENPQAMCRPAAKPA